MSLVRQDERLDPTEVDSNALLVREPPYFGLAVGAGSFRTPDSIQKTIANQIRFSNRLIGAPSTAGRSLPICPNQQTFSEAVSMSQRCQKRKWRDFIQ